MVDTPLNAYQRVPPPSDPDSAQSHLDGELQKLERTTRETIAKLQSVASTYATIDSPVLTGDPKAPTPATADNDTSIATTAFVKAQDYATNTALTSGLATKAPTVHTHAQSDVTGLAASLAAKEPSVTGSGASTDYYGGDKAFHALPPQKLVAAYVVRLSTSPTVTTLFPAGSTVPASTDGTEVLSVSVTTTSSTQVIDFVFSSFFSVAATGATRVAAGVFVNGVCTAATVQGNVSSGAGNGQFIISNRYAPGAAGTYTFTVRIGPVTATSVFVNSLFGTAGNTSLTANVIEP